ncbi:alpha-L-rhamnosidase [Parabacteroides sp. PF5-5]|uniref:alpha-L-rhamnosidase-related protein n=1 Tax=unclassified Parabacteroides TaxID=2649774 RepID=UPI002474246D|nr:MULTISPECIES: alpha-L-rhamnosidase C-terminal domain-containing protein [unclassified Parabacteroides]MDH6304167.1 alpha-L-rhamnosidase [Parabacteroides sp. PH5-39]MDH6315117.1 alpha-L-rhamnosidase [Parabacteroides sp. PF5-13]MDH6318778.1 alpha-L-rhamnosidase [Parabacteroides sp. PH5-13]MDH6322507.1 alpha-L-rhamnosidase [Parabacteroides sp. PH5-8]MDH6326357.1 alpha-L-rhamnosidase [Parabacteroides sp. PH5-41]
MKHTHFLFLFCLLACLSATAQIRLTGYNQSEINPALLEGGRWDARWISLPGEPANTYGIYHFRKSFDLKDVPGKFVVHVSADNRYKLYVNGTLVSLGPARGDIYNWNFETVDISPWLTKGKNTLAAVVWNYAEQKPVAQISMNQTGFLLQGNTDTEKVVNTNNSWLCIKNEAYSPWTDWQVLGYYVAGPGELLNASAYPWGWERPDYDDSQWQKARSGIEGAVKGARDYPGRLLVPSPIPPMTMELERLPSVRIAEGVKCPDDFPKRSASFCIPANTKARLLLDNQQLTTGYFSFLYSQGKDAEITIAYAEALHEDSSESTTKSYSLNPKGHRDRIDGKLFIGYADKIIADGGENRDFTTLWWRTWRYVDIQISTSDEPLVIDDIYGTFSAYPFVSEYAFDAPAHPELNKMLDIGWLTARLCANETYMDCPYYEQLQYFGDTRIQAMITMYNTRDPYMVKNAIEQGRQSIVAEGITMSRYPSALHQFISSFSLWWICTGHDYWMYRGDEEYMKSLLPAYRGVLAWYEQWLKPDMSLDYVPHWFFADWSAGLDYGEPVREKNGNSAFQDVLYILALDAVSEMEEAIGLSSMARHYKKIASGIRSTMRKKYWDEERKLFADTHDHRSYSQHVNALIILAGIVEGEEAAEVMERTLADKDLKQATIYFRYYLHQALNKAGLGDQLFENLQIWRDQMALGLTTWAEMPEPSRSDCHAWGSSPNIELYRIVLGIDSDAPGFKKIRIAPSLGKLKEVSGSMPHPFGTVKASYSVDKKGKLTATLSLPSGTSGTFIWKGKEYPLSAGEQQIIL